MSIHKQQNNSQIYVLDTNILLIDPNCIFSYPGAMLIIPFSAIEELDKFKHQVNLNGQRARAFLDIIDNLRQEGPLAKGVKLNNGSILKVWVDNKVNTQMPVFSNMSKSSNQVFSSLLSIKDEYKNSNITLISNDLNLRVRVSLKHIEASSYHKDKLATSDIYKPIQKITVTSKQLDELHKFDHIQMPDNPLQLYPNQHIIVEDDKHILCRYIARSQYLKKVPDYHHRLWNINPRNIEQWAATDLLLDKNISIVSLAGKAGTGKTLLALAAALVHLLNPHSVFKILVSRPIVPLGKDIGYLPGEISEKISPWMQPIFDNLELLANTKGSAGRKQLDISKLINQNLIELEALTYIRGRSIPNRFMIIDEAQNLTPHEVKTIITRTGENTKLVLTGDPYQIDNPFVDLASNGLTYVIEKLKRFDIAGDAQLIKGERSLLAEMAANFL